MPDRGTGCCVLTSPARACTCDKKQFPKQAILTPSARGTGRKPKSWAGTTVKGPDGTGLLNPLFSLKHNLKVNNKTCTAAASSGDRYVVIICTACAVTALDPNQKLHADRVGHFFLLLLTMGDLVLSPAAFSAYPGPRLQPPPGDARGYGDPKSRPRRRDSELGAFGTRGGGGGPRDSQLRGASAPPSPGGWWWGGTGPRGWRRGIEFHSDGETQRETCAASPVEEGAQGPGDAEPRENAGPRLKIDLQTRLEPRSRS
ncbi:unnamed protein product [Lampetra fluviatilis]